MNLVKSWWPWSNFDFTSVFASFLKVLILWVRQCSNTIVMRRIVEWTRCCRRMSLCTWGSQKQIQEKKTRFILSFFSPFNVSWWLGSGASSFPMIYKMHHYSRNSKSLKLFNWKLDRNFHKIALRSVGELRFLQLSGCMALKRWNSTFEPDCCNHSNTWHPTGHCQCFTGCQTWTNLHIMLINAQSFHSFCLLCKIKTE